LNIICLGLNCVRSIGLPIAISLLSISAIVGQEPAKPEPVDKSATQKTESSARTEKNTPKPAFTLSVRTKPILNLSLKAEKARLSEIAGEIAKRLKVQVFVGDSLKDEIVSMEFSELTLEPAMQLMAPAVYIDYEIDSGSGIPKPLGIFFYDNNQGEPPLTAVIAGSTQSLLIEGDTEDGVEPQTEEEKKKQEEQPLRVRFENNSISVKAKKQPLPLVLLKIGEELGIPVDIQFDTKDLVDAEITKLSIEDAVRRLSPNIRLFLRANLTHAERRALRLVLTDPTKSAQQGL